MFKPDLTELKAKLESALHLNYQSITCAHHEVTVEVAASDILKVCECLKNNEILQFTQLTDLCVVDYLHYGVSQWATEAASNTGFERGVRPISETVPDSTWKKSRFAVVYHFLSIHFNFRVRIKTFLPDEEPIIDSIVSLFANADWYEREAFDLYGVLFNDHPDLRRLLTDYGFIGHPFRKDYPLIGESAVHYDGLQGRVVYSPVDIEPRTLVPKVIRKKESQDA